MFEISLPQSTCPHVKEVAAHQSHPVYTQVEYVLAYDKHSTQVPHP